MSALLTEELVKAAPARHLRVVEDLPEQESFLPESLLRPSAPRPLATVIPLPVPARPAQPAAARVSQDAPVVLTRRGVLVVRAALIAFVAVLAVVVGVLAGMALRPAAPEAGASVIVGSGQSLWSIAEESAAPGADVRDVVAEIVALNGLTSSTVHAGQSLVLPAP